MLVGRMGIKESGGKERERLDRRLCKAPVRVMMWVVLVRVRRMLDLKVTLGP